MPTVYAPDITKKLFGGIFDVDGSGHYPGLELINLVVCCAEGTLPATDKVDIVAYLRQSSTFPAGQLPK